MPQNSTPERDTATPAPVQGSEGSSARREARTRALVLVVEDHPEMSRLLVDTLAPDYEVATALNGREGLEEARALRPDLVLTDVMMPEMGGDELVRALRAESELASTPILVLTAKLDQDLRVRLLREGAQDYVVKPFSVEELRARVGNLVTMKRARDVLQQTLASQSHDLAALAEMLSQRQEDLAAANRAKDEFLATLSHELRTPVTGMLAWLWMLRRGHLDEPAAARAYETMEGSIRSLVRIIDDLLDVSRIIRGQLRLEVKPISLVPVVQSAIDAVRPAADAKQIRLETTIDPAAGPVHGDAARFQQVVWNLLMNSIKFTPAGGRVSVQLARRGADVDVTVRDTGIGIPREFLPHVFERFRQADGGTTREHGGLGLGLAIVRHLVELHGGTVSAESPGRDEGATFTITLPLIAAHEPASDGTRPARQDDAPAVTTPLRGLRVLVVEDEPLTREALTALLTQAGAEVGASASAAHALEVLRTWRPSVLVADIAMPDQDGYALLRKVRALGSEEGRDVPVLALTAHARPEDRERALRAGFQAYLAKPVDPPTLLEAIFQLAETSGRPPAPPEPRDRPVSTAHEDRREGTAVGGETILLVEDDPANRDYSRAVLEQFGYRVLVARSGEEGLRVWKAHRDEINLVVTDLVMLPGCSGVQVCHAVHEQRADVPVITLSGYPLVAQMLQDGREGPVECLQKPIEPEDLATAVRRALDRAQTS
jgi:CheY-like chemotaxis protein